MISVAIALYNSMRFIEEQLNSIRRQILPVDEVVMVDDCSTDGTYDFVSEYITKNNISNWLLFQHRENKGYIKTFREAINVCHGDIIILCDHDDVWLENKTQIVRDEFDKNPDMTVLATSFIQIDESGNNIKIHQKHNHGNNNLIRRKIEKEALTKMTVYDVVVYNISPGCTCAFRSRIKAKFMSVKGVLPHDWILTTIGACEGSLYYLDIVTTKYRIYTGNTIGLGHIDEYNLRKSIVANNLEEKEAIYNIVKDHFITTDKELEYCRKLIHVFELREEFLKTKNYLIGLKALIKAIPYGKLYESVVMDIVAVAKN